MHHCLSAIGYYWLLSSLCDALMGSHFVSQIILRGGTNHVFYPKGVTHEMAVTE
jgi:hypothetical protein